MQSVYIYLRYLGYGIQDNFFPAVLAYLGIRLLIGRFALRETAVRFVLSLLCLANGVALSSVVGRLTLNSRNYREALLLSGPFIILTSLAAWLAARQGELRNPFVARRPASHITHVEDLPHLEKRVS